MKHLLAVSAAAYCLSAAMAEIPVAPGATLEKLAGGFRFTEGPSADPEGNVYFTDQPSNRIHRWSTAGELATFLEPAGRSNGLCADGKGGLYACADERNELWHIDLATKKHEVLIKDYGGKLLNGPNDVWVHPDGGIYFTDPFFKRPYWSRGPAEQDGKFIYHLSADRKALRRVSGDLGANGVVGTPDGKTLYAACGGVMAFDILSDGSLGAPRKLYPGGFDGLTLDEEGNLYMAGKGVVVADRHGTYLGTIDVPEGWSANVCFGGADMRTLFITASRGLYGLKMRVAGSPQ